MQQIQMEAAFEAYDRQGLQDITGTRNQPRLNTPRNTCKSDYRLRAPLADRCRYTQRGHRVAAGQGNGEQQA